jgi:hypothetical protein
MQARSETVSTLIAQIVRFSRPNIQIYDARVGDLYQWVRARYDDPTSADDVNAAAKLHVELISRITTQRLPYAAGVEATALKSVNVTISAV